MNTVFPFQITFRRTLNIHSTADGHEVLTFIKKIVRAESPYPKNLNVSANVFSFKVDFWDVGRGSLFEGIGKASFRLDNRGEDSLLIYTYRIGGLAVIFPFLFAIPFLILLFKDPKKNISLAPRLLITYLSVSIIFWFITLFKMNRLFKLIVAQVESKYTKPF
jgi:hypothetical protein